MQRLRHGNLNERIWAGLAVLCLSSGLLGCGAGTAITPNDVPPEQDPGDPPAPLVLPAQSEDRMRFLTRATFGPNEHDFTRLGQIGYQSWFVEQLLLPASLHRPLLEAQGQGAGQFQRQDVWWKLSVTAPDQLRQRMAFALSELFVVSQHDKILLHEAVALADYYDLLVQGSFGNFRDLLEGVTRSPVMGVYLSMFKNEKADLESAEHPDENFAREIMQLFTIGLVQLTPSGQVASGPGGVPIATYSQHDIEEMARIFTGWNFAGAASWDSPQVSLGPMQNWSEYHDQAAKTLPGGVFVPAGQTGQQDLDQALDLLFLHPNVGPFFARHLITRLVTSNPTADYVQRVAAVFADNGAGVRGDLAAVLWAVLSDQQAFTGHITDPEDFGKLREPMLRITALWRAFGGVPQNGKYQLWESENTLGQAPLSSQTVFNFFRADYSHPGVVQDSGLVAPELEISDEVRIVLGTNLIRTLLVKGYPEAPFTSSEDVWMDFSDERALAAEPAELIDHLDLLLMGGSMPAAMRSLLIDHLETIPMNFGDLPDGTQRVLDAVQLILISPQGAVQV